MNSSFILLPSSLFQNGGSLWWAIERDSSGARNLAVPDHSAVGRKEGNALHSRDDAQSDRRKARKQIRAGPCRAGGTAMLTVAGSDSTERTDRPDTGRLCASVVVSHGTAMSHSLVNRDYSKRIHKFAASMFKTKAQRPSAGDLGGLTSQLVPPQAG